MNWFIELFSCGARLPGTYLYVSIKQIFTDTDSLTVEVQTDDIYKDMEERKDDWL